MTAAANDAFSMSDSTSNMFRVKPKSLKRWSGASNRAESHPTRPLRHGQEWKSVPNPEVHSTGKATEKVSSDELCWAHTQNHTCDFKNIAGVRGDLCDICEPLMRYPIDNVSAIPTQDTNLERSGTALQARAANLL